MLSENFRIQEFQYLQRGDRGEIERERKKKKEERRRRREGRGGGREEEGRGGEMSIVQWGEKHNNS